MIELDYAFLADYAAVQEGKLNVIGASFTELRTESLPSETMLSVAGRIRSSVDVPEIEASIVISPPDGSFSLAADIIIDDLQELTHYDGKRGLLFAVQLMVPLPSEGLYKVELDIKNTEHPIDRVLKFDVQPAKRQ